LPGFLDQYIGFTIAALFFVLAVSAVLFLYYFLAKGRFGGTVKLATSRTQTAPGTNKPGNF
jgi:hypothetical protein